MLRRYYLAECPGGTAVEKNDPTGIINQTKIKLSASSHEPGSSEVSQKPKELIIGPDDIRPQEKCVNSSCGAAFEVTMKERELCSRPRGPSSALTAGPAGIIGQRELPSEPPS